MIRKVIRNLEDLLETSDRLGSDEIFAIEEAIADLKNFQKYSEAEKQLKDENRPFQNSRR